MIDTNSLQFQEVWDSFLKEWPLARLRRMTLPEYTAVGQDHTFTAWMERRLDKMGSIWGGSSFKFGIYSRKDKTAKAGGEGASYSEDYAWYTKYGSSPEAAFAKVKSIVAQVAEAAARGDYASIDAADLGESYKWKIAFHYQDRKNPGVIAAFKPARLKAWLTGRIGTVPQQTSELHRQILSLNSDRELLDLSGDVWQQTAAVEPPDTPDPPDSELDQDQPLNLILYGAPGTGKTYLTSELAVKICDGVVPESREALTARYRELKNLRRIRFVTFHPSFSYEEFVDHREHNLGISSADVYQVLAYAHRYQTDLAVLVYPHRGALGRAGVQKEFLIQGGHADGVCVRVATVDLASLASVAEQLERGVLLGWRETRVG